jgi:hypothetical protein
MTLPVSRVIVIGGMSSAWTLFAESAAAPTDWGNLTALGAVIVVLIFIVTKMLPDLHQKSVEQTKIFSDALRDMNMAQGSVIDKMQSIHLDTLDKISAREEALTAAVGALRENCAGHWAANERETK